MTAGRENVAIFNPLVLPLPNWHPDGPDGKIDGYVVPFLMPSAVAGASGDRGAQIRVMPVEGATTGWHAEQTTPYIAETAAQARALAAAWIRAAEVLDNVGARDPIVDAEVVEDDEAEGKRS